MHKRGIHCRMQDQPWTLQQLNKAMKRGFHQSAKQHRDFLHGEMLEMIKHGQWVILPYELIKHLPYLRIIPLGIIPQHDWRPCTIADYTWSRVNGVTIPLAPKEAMQFGCTLYRLLQQITWANPIHGPVYMLKIDVSDGFYRVHVAPTNIAALGIAFPGKTDAE